MSDSAAASTFRLVNVRGLGKAPGYSHLAEVTGGRTIYLSGQIATNAAGEVVGLGDFTTQARQVFRNIGLALEALELTFHSVVKLTVFLVDLGHLTEFRMVRDEFVNTTTPPASSLVQVAGLIRPELLIEVEAIAVAP